ncbi:hypothetical protein FNF27_03298 [Cafeteria roenbergensis]|uniref:GST N-terminal domain-containing protein n=1 Tax=Cafeteria roenbergensis TaxID=33653 RepID=A0A5A8CVF4_CAFRO|nr:hypothetical protein FNF31_06053 [Cafeteria roenbergensis]KAA0175290.1 hypothetical protein FNF27_03298 [Cafeteria roenbergensis]
MAASPASAPAAGTDGAVLHYFNGRGLAEQIRFMLAVTGVEWADRHLVKREQFQELKASGVLPWDQVPLLELDGERFTQSMAAVRHLARRAGLYGDGPSQAARCDIIADGIRDALGAFSGVPFAPDRDAALSAARDRMVGKYLPCLERMLRANDAVPAAVKEAAAALSAAEPSLAAVPPPVGASDGEAAGLPAAGSADAVFLVGGAVTFPDVTVTEVLCYIAELLPDVGATAGKQWPLVVAHQRAMLACGAMRKFFGSRHRHALGDAVYKAEVRAVLA